MLAALIAVGCASTRDEPRLPHASLDALQAPAASAPPARERELAPLLARVAAEHGLARGAVPELIELPPEELAAEARRVVQRDTPAQSVETYTRALTALELVPPDFDWLEAALAGLAPGLRAFYDPQRRIVFSDRTLPSRARRRAHVHELVHVLQLELPAREEALDPLPSSWDRDSALHALREGDAELFVELWEGPEAFDEAPGPTPQSDAASAPGVVLRSMTALYSDGRRAIERVHAAGGWNAVNALLADPPQSTRRLLHPDATLDARASPPLPPPPGEGWALGAEGVFGEQTLRCVLSEWTSPERAEALASAWRGDRLAWYRDGAQTALAWRFDLDSPASARQLRAIFSTGLSLLPQRETSALPSRASCRAHRDGGVIGVASQTEQVWVLRLHGLSTEAGCREVSAWLAQLAPRSPASRADPGPRPLTGLR